MILCKATFHCEAIEANKFFTLRLLLTLRKELFSIRSSYLMLVFPILFIIMFHLPYVIYRFYVQYFYYFLFRSFHLCPRTVSKSDGTFSSKLSRRWNSLTIESRRRTLPTFFPYFLFISSRISGSVLLL